MYAKTSKILIASSLFAIWIMWLTFLLVKPELTGVFSKFRYSEIGVFGDAFGVIASLMTTIAAAGVYLTFVTERESRRRQQFEQNFFALLSNLESITGQIAIFRYTKD